MLTYRKLLIFCSLSVFMSCESTVVINGQSRMAIESSICPQGYVRLPESVENSLGGGELCVAKYEMKAQTLAGDPVFDGTSIGAGQTDFYLPDSRPGGVPWVRISFTDARHACSRLGSNFSMLTLRQWNTIAQNLEAVPQNWTTGVAYSGQLFTGHSDGATDPQAVALGYAAGTNRVLAADTDSLPYAGTGNAETSGLSQRRIHYLSNGEAIWDMAGNARDMVDADGLGSTVSYTRALE